MTTNFRLAFESSPFLPPFDQTVVVENCVRDISRGYQHAPAIALAIMPLMSCHTLLLGMEYTTLKNFSISDSGLDMLNLGYQYPLSTIIASAVCIKYPEVQRASIFKKLLKQPYNSDCNRAQQQIARDQRATINLLRLDPSGALVFQFLKDYPFSQDEFFLNGMEIAAIIYFGIALEVAKATGNEWLNTPYDPTIT